MKTRALLGLVLVGAILAGGCGDSKESRPPTESRAQAKAEQKQVRTVERSESDFPNLMNQWTREGWLVTATSKRATNADGTIHRLVWLTKRNP